MRALVRLVHNLTDEAARRHGPVRWLLLRAMPRLLYWEMGYAHNHPCLQALDPFSQDDNDMDYDEDDEWDEEDGGIVFPDADFLDEDFMNNIPNMGNTYRDRLMMQYPYDSEHGYMPDFGRGYLNKWSKEPRSTKPMPRSNGDESIR